MPAYGKFPFSKTVFPGQNALVVGFPAIPPGGPSALANDQGESLATAYKSIPVCVAPVAGMGVGYPQRQISWQTVFTLAASALTLILQGSINDVDAEYQTVDTSSATGGETRTVASNMRFFRVLGSSVTGACTGTVKITAL